MVPSVLRYTNLSSPVGELLIASCDQGICLVTWREKYFAKSARLRTLKLEPAKSSTLLELHHQLAQYFAGSRATFELDLHFCLCTGFQTQVLKSLNQVPYGETVSYQQLALKVSTKAAARAVGNALATNPLAIVLPCHRVLTASGKLGGYLGGMEAKKFLLELEAKALADSKEQLCA